MYVNSEEPFTSEPSEFVYSEAQPVFFFFNLVVKLSGRKGGSIEVF